MGSTRKQSISRSLMVSLGERYRSLLDPITHEAMQDPVTAADGHTYDRQSISQWFAACKARARPITSPLTNMPLASGELIPNNPLRDLVEELLLEARKSAEGDETKGEADLLDQSPCRPAIDQSQLMLSSEIFEDLDKLMEMDLMHTLNLRPPQIVVIGNESHGKSTLLERLIGFPIFPRDKGLCTRCPIRVHLRRNTASIATVAIREKSPFGTFSTMDEEPVALENLCEMVNAKMNGMLLRNEAISLSKEIIVRIQVSYCPNLDIIDLPGLVAANKTFAGSTQNVAEVTRSLATSVVENEKDHSLFLLVVDVRCRADQSIAAGVVQSLNIANKTLGVFTMFDAFRSQYDDDQEDEIRECLQGTSAGSVPLPRGWLGCSSRTTRQMASARPMDRLIAMEENEALSMMRDYPRLVEEQRVGMPVVRLNTQLMYEKFLSTNWVPAIRKHLVVHFLKKSDENANLGLPMPFDADYVDVVTQLQTSIKGSDIVIEFPQYEIDSMVRLNTSDEFEEILKQRATAVLSRSNWMSFEVCQVWQEISEFSSWLEQLTSMWNKSPQMQLHLVDHESSTATDMILKRLEHMKRHLFEFGNGDVVPALSQKFVAAVLGRSSHRRRNLIENAMRVVLSTFADEDQPTVLKFDRFSDLEREFENHVRSRLQELSANFLRSADNLISTIQDNIITFPLIEQRFSVATATSFVEQQTTCVDDRRLRVRRLRQPSFTFGDNLDGSGTFVSGRSDETFLSGGVSCQLLVSPQAVKLPNLLIGLWIKSVVQVIPTIVSEWQVPPTCMNESCKRERLEVLNEMVDVVNVLSALKNLEDKVALDRPLEPDELVTQHTAWAENVTLIQNPSPNPNLSNNPNLDSSSNRSGLRAADDVQHWQGRTAPVRVRATPAEEFFNDWLSGANG